MELGIEQVSLFEVPAWRASFAWLESDLGHMIDDIDLLLATSDLPMTYPGRQTRPVLQTLETDHWQRLYAAIGAVGQGIVDSDNGRFARPNARLADVASWALELQAPYDLRATRHSHAGATLSSVLWLTLPAEWTSEGGTTFFDPLAFLQPAQSSHSTRAVSPHPLELLMFPWWVEHCPTPVNAAVDARRLVIATDLTFR